MPRAHRYFIPNQVWHITHRCHQKSFLLKFARDRKRWLYWLFEARKRYGLCVLNYIVTSNHIHLLVFDNSNPGSNIISKSMQLIAGRTAQEYNQRKNRKGAYWEDRYHATAIDRQDYLMKCMAYIDLNMVRTGVVVHPRDWVYSGYNEIQLPPQRYSIIDTNKLIELAGYNSLEALQKQHRHYIDMKLLKGDVTRESKWVDSLAVGGESFINNVSDTLGIKAKYRSIVSNDEEYQIKEGEISYRHDF